MKGRIVPPHRRTQLTGRASDQCEAETRITRTPAPSRRAFRSSVIPSSTTTAEIASSGQARTIAVVVRAQSEKRRIAELAVQYVEPDSTIALDSGTTVLELAKLLPADHGLTVVSNSLPALSALSRRADINLIGVGGQ